MGNFVNQEKMHLHPIFSLFWREHFGGVGEKTFGFYQFFSLTSLQPNIRKKCFTEQLWDYNVCVVSYDYFFLLGVEFFRTLL